IEGAGHLSWISAHTQITNQHLIIANRSNALQIYPGSQLFTNEGTMRAEDGGTLRLASGTYNNTGGLIEARTGSTVELDNALIAGGTLEAEGDGLFSVTGSTPELDTLTNAAH